MSDVDARLDALYPQLPHHLRGANEFLEQVFSDDVDELLSRIRDMFPAGGFYLDFEWFCRALCEVLNNEIHSAPSMTTKAYYVRCLCLAPGFLYVIESLLGRDEIREAIREHESVGLIALIGHRYDGVGRYRTLIMCSEEEDAVAYALIFS